MLGEEKTENIFQQFGDQVAQSEYKQLIEDLNLNLDNWIKDNSVEQQDLERIKKAQIHKLSVLQVANQFTDPDIQDFPIFLLENENFFSSYEESEINYLAVELLNQLCKKIVEERLSLPNRNRVKSTISEKSSDNVLPRTIYFYNQDEEYYEFSNFSPNFPILCSLPFRRCGSQLDEFIDNPDLPLNLWSTSEHLFLATKFFFCCENKEKKRKIIKDIRESKSAQEAYYLANTVHESDYDHQKWKKINVPIMRWVLKKKFAQHPGLSILLRDTGFYKIVEHTNNDSFWGDGGNGSGRNKLGEELTFLRGWIFHFPEYDIHPEIDSEEFFWNEIEAAENILEKREDYKMTRKSSKLKRLNRLITNLEKYEQASPESHEKLVWEMAQSAQNLLAELKILTNQLKQEINDSIQIQEQETIRQNKLQKPKNTEQEKINYSLVVITGIIAVVIGIVVKTVIFYKSIKRKITKLTRP